MSKRTLNVVIDCGELTCAREPGEFCDQARTTHFGTRWVCGLFDHAELSDLEDGPKKGWLGRCKQCLAAESSGKDLATPSAEDLEAHRKRILKRHGRA